MKLIFCPQCSDMFKLHIGVKKLCVCGNSWGKYKDEFNAVIGGKAIPIGIENNSLQTAIIKRHLLESRNINAFVIPYITPSIEQ